MNTKPIIILGMQRSGTSALSGALNRLGVSFGNETMLYAADANNSKGYFEHRRITSLNLRCLETFQMHPTSLDRLPVTWNDHPLASGLQDELRQFLKEEFVDGSRWAIKQPLTSLLLPLYQKVFADLGLSPHYVVCVRSPIETMASESALRFDSTYRVMPKLGARAVGSWLRYTLGSLADVVGEHVSVVPFSRLLAEPKFVLAELVDSHGGWDPGAQLIQEAAGSIDVSLKRQASNTDDLDRFPPMVRRTFDLLTARDAWSPVEFDRILELHREFEVWRRILDEPAAPAGKLGLAWLADGKRNIAESGFVPNGSWQTVRLTVDAPPRTMLSGLIYAYPCRIWIRRSVWRRGDSVSPATIRSGPGSELGSEQGFHRLDAAFESTQIQVVTPGGAGPYELQIEFFMETGETSAANVATMLARKLDECVVRFERRSGA